MPWEIFTHDGQHCLRNQQTGKLVAGSCHADRDKTLAMMRALYANVPDARGKSMEDIGNEAIYGGTVKALGNGRVGGYVALFTSEHDPDIVRDFFDSSTDTYVQDGDQRPIIYNHGLDKVIKRRKLAQGTVKIDDAGVWMEGQLALRDEYERKIYKMAEEGKLGWSTGSAPHLVARSKRGKSFHLDSWPIVEASLTPTPMEPRAFAVSLKSLAESNIDLDDLKLDSESFFEPADPEAKATWTTTYINDLPDSSFAYIEPGGKKDEDGRTWPRSARHFAYKTADGRPDEAQIRSILTQIPQANVSGEAKAHASAIIRRAAKTLGIEVANGKSMTFTEHFLSVVTAVEDHTKTATELVEDVTSLADRIRDRLEFRETKDGRTISAANRERLSATSANLQALIQAVQQMSAEINDLISMAEPKPKVEPVPLADQILTEVANFEALQFELANSHR